MTSTSRTFISVLLSGVLSLFVLASTPALAQEQWREGWCREGEGQTVVVDFGGTPPSIKRCINVDNGYPITSDIGEAVSALLSAGFQVSAPGGFIVEIEGHAADPHWLISGAAKPGQWDGRGHYIPPTEVDTFFGFAVAEPELSHTFPAEHPQLGPPLDVDPPVHDPDNGEGPGNGEDPNDGESPGPSPGPEDGTAPPVPDPSSTETPHVDASPSPTAGPTNAPPPTASPTAPSQPQASPTPAPSRSSAPVPPRSPEPTVRPSPTTQTPEPEENESVNSPAPADQVPDSDAGESPEPAQAEATPVWGREGTQRREGDDSVPPEAPLWAPLIALAAGVMLFGGLGGAFTVGLRQATRTGPVDEE